MSFVSTCISSRYAEPGTSFDEESPLLENMTNQETSTRSLVGAEGGSKLPQFLAAFIATIGGFSMGTMLGWTSPTQEQITTGGYGFEVSLIQFSLIGAFVSIGAMIGALSCGAVSDCIGRKKTMIGLVCPALIGLGLMLWAESPIMMMAGRIIVGIPVGAYTVVCPLYTNEIGQKSISGVLGTFFQLQVNLGILLTYLLGLWKNTFMLTLIDAVFPITLAVLICFMPETPNYLLKIGRDAEAKKSLQWLRGKNYNVDEELSAIKDGIVKMQSEQVSFAQAFTTKAAKKGLLIGIGIMFLQQFSGINAVIFYAGKIFRSSGSSMDESVASIIVGAMCVISTAAATLFIDRLGRKPLLMLSCSVMALSSGVLGLFFYFQDHNPDIANKILFVPLASICLFIIVFSVGLGPIPWMILGEIFPPNIKGPASSISCLTNWIFTFTVTLAFQSVLEAIGSDFTFWFFSLVMFVGCFFVYFIIPETKGKTIDQVQRELEGGNSSRNYNFEHGGKF